MPRQKVNLDQGAIIGDKLDFTPILTPLIFELESETVLEFESGDYHFWPDKARPRELYISNTDSRSYPYKQIGIVIEGKQGLHLKGQQTRFVFHGSMGAMAILDSQNITLEGIQIDYDCPSVIDLTVVQIEQTVDYPQVEVEIPLIYGCEVKDNQVFWQSELSPYTGKPYWEGQNGLDLSQHLSVRKQTVGRTEQGLFWGYQQVEKKGQRLLVTYQQKRGIEVGDVFQMRQTKREVIGVFVSHSREITFNGIWFSFLYGMGVISQMSDTLTFKHCLFKPTMGRYSASAADMLHFSGCRGEIIVEECQFQNPHDDMINVHGTFLAVEKIAHNELLVSYQHHQTLGFNPFVSGDKIQLYDTQSLLPVSELYEVRLSEAVSDSDLTHYRVVIEGAFKESARTDLVVDNVSASPDVRIEKSHFYQCPTRGILVSSRGKIRIKNNFFAKITMACLFISCDANDWFESGPVKDVLIEGNTFKDCQSYAVLVEPTNHVLSDVKVHQNIVVRANRLIGMREPYGSFKSVKEVVWSTNTNEKGKLLSVSSLENISSDIQVN